MINNGYGLRYFYGRTWGIHCLRIAKTLAIPIPWWAIDSNSFWQALHSGLKKVISRAWHSGQIGVSTAGWTMGLGLIGMLLKTGLGSLSPAVSKSGSCLLITGSEFQGAGDIFKNHFFLTLFILFFNSEKVYFHENFKRTHVPTGRKKWE